MAKKQSADSVILSSIADELKSQGLDISNTSIITDKDLQRFSRALFASPDIRWKDEFTHLFNRIAYRIISNRAWDNPLSFVIKDQDFGAGVEEVYAAIAEPLAYDAFGEGEEVWKRVMPDIRSTLHVMNVKYFVEQTIYPAQLKKAFSNFGEWMNFREFIVENMSTAYNKARYDATMYILALYIIETGGVAYHVPSPETDAKASTKALKVLSDKFKFLKSDYNAAGVPNHVPKKNIYLFVTPEFDAEQTVDVYSYMFNVEQAQIDSRKIIVDSFADFDYNTLNNIFVGGVPKVFTEEEIRKLQKIHAFICSDRLLMVYNQDIEWGAPYNDRKRYWNYYLHDWGTYSYSPYENGVALYSGPEEEPSKIINPFESQSINIGRDNYFYVRPAYASGILSNREKCSVQVTGEALKAIPGKPGWYVAGNEIDKTATITYSVTGVDDLVITVRTI